MKNLLIITLFLCASLALQAQTVTNVVAQQIGNTIEVSYDLDKVATISLFLSQDGGTTYAATPKALSGDVGKNVSAGHKKIVWNLMQDGNEWHIEKARFKVVAEDKNKKNFSIQGVSFTMILVEGGTFTMGATYEQGKDARMDESPSHSVTLGDYYIGQTEVTQALWKAVMGNNPSYFKRDEHPVEQVSWDDCQQFVKKLNTLLSSELGGKHFALPTEAQWEYAARGGKKSNGYKYSGSDTNGKVAWYEDNAGRMHHSVAGKSANELGIYDMSGNVWEWCRDWYGSYSSYSQSNPTGESSGSRRVVRGGSCCTYAWICRVAYRERFAPSTSDLYLGLRLVCY